MSRVRSARWLAGLALAGMATASLAQPLPPRSEWRASSSSNENPAMAAPFGIDGDPATRWGGGFSPGHWYQVDLGRVASVGGVMLQWDSGYARRYSLQASVDGTAWTTVFETVEGLGGIEYDLFPAVDARFVRIAAPSRTADWGVSIFEFEPIAADDAPRVTGLAGQGEIVAPWSGSMPHTIAADEDGTHRFDIALPRPLPLAGLEVTWSPGPHAAQLEARDDEGSWTVMAEDRRNPGNLSWLAADTPRTVHALRVTTRDHRRGPPAVQRLRLLGPTRTMTPMKRYELASTRFAPHQFPASLQQKQVYWTAIGIPGGQQKSVFDEYGNLEAFKGAPLVQPIWRDPDGMTEAARPETPRTHRLREGWMPLPSVQWQPDDGIELTSEAFTIEQDGAPVTLLRHRVRNLREQRLQGSLALVTRPMQISPPWQNGGPSPMRDLAIEGEGVGTVLRVNGRVLYHALTAPDAAGAAAFGPYGEGEIGVYVGAGAVPPERQARDPSGLAAAAMRFDIDLAPGAHRDIVLAFALGTARLDPQAGPLAPAPALDAVALAGDDAGTRFDQLADATAAQWHARLGRIGLTLPDMSLVDMLRAQSAYMLINQTGQAIQPGPRNYNRSFIRDGSATAAILARMGMARTARDYARWYGEHAVHANGLVSPILNDDGSVNTGFGSDLEHDSQGQFVWLIAEIARLDGGADTVREHAPQVERALRFLQELRERTLVPGYQAERPAPERFRGLLAPSISHEGYSVPTHSYWDDYWGIRGWHDGAWLLEQWGDKDGARWAREQGKALRDSTAASIRATMAWAGTDFIPSSADLGDGDPTGVSIGLDPTGARDVMPPAALATTFDRYLADVRKRDAPGALYAYTPYEMRNVLTYVHLDRPQDANELLMRLLDHRRPAPWQVLAEVIYSDLRHPIYLGDMPHTWIGAEYARAIFGMLMHEADDRLVLLPGTPPSWVAGDGLRVDALPTAHGALSMTARDRDGRLEVTLGEGVRVPVSLKWPSRTRPSRVTVDGTPVRDYAADGIVLDKPFRTLVAER